MIIGMEQTTEISEQTLETLVAKYKCIFETKFPNLQLSVYFTPNGQPPTPDEYRNTPETTEAMGLFVKVDKDYRIGIRQNQSVELRLLTFFHEYGHAMYRRETNEAIDNPEALVRTETAALLKSLELADAEGLSEIALHAVGLALLLASKNPDPVYRAAFNNVKKNPLWLKYSGQSE